MRADASLWFASRITCRAASLPSHTVTVVSRRPTTAPWKLRNPGMVGSCSMILRLASRICCTSPSERASIIVSDTAPGAAELVERT